MREILVIASIAALVAFTWALCQLVTWVTAEPRTEPSPVRGRALSSAQEMAKRALRSSSDRLATWGLVPQSHADLLEHALVLGGTGSGKSITIGCLLAELAPRFSTDIRAFIFDPKGTYWTLLTEHLGVTNAEHLHPFSARSPAQDHSSEALGPEQTEAIAHSWIPSVTGDRQPHFVNTSRALFVGVLQTLSQLGPGNWSLADAVRICLDQDVLRRFLLSNPNVAHLARTHLRGDGSEESASVISTLTTAIGRFASVAAASHPALQRGHTFTTKKLIEGREPKVVVLGFDMQRKEVLQGYMASLVELLIRRLFDQGECPRSVRTALIIDELALLGKIPALETALSAGRSRGLSVVLGVQAVEQIRAIYGRDQADAILGAPRLRCSLSTSSPQTAEWLSSVAGQQEAFQESYSSSTTTDRRGEASTNAGESMGLQTKPVVLPSEFLSLRPPGPSSPLLGLYESRDGLWWATTPSTQFPPQTASYVPEAVPVEQRQLSMTWSDGDLARLGLAADRPSGSDHSESLLF